MEQTIEIVDEIIIDSYPEINYDNTFPIYTGLSSIGQAFKNINAHRLDKAKFYIKKYGTLTGNVTASLYACDGTPGIDGKKVEPPLATSNPIDASTLYTSLQLVSFIFPIPYNMKALTNYVIACEFNDGDANNFIKIGVDTSNLTHPGNTTLSTGFSSINDTIFYIIEMPTPLPPPTQSPILLIIGVGIGVATLIYYLSKKRNK